MEKFTLQNLDCANCAAEIEQAVKKTPGVNFVSVDFASTTLFIDSTDLPSVKQTIRRVEPNIKILKKSDDTISEDGFDIRKKVLLILVAGSLFLGGLIFLEPLRGTKFGFGEWLVFGLAYLISGWGVLMGAIRNVSRGQIFDEKFLMAIATIGAILIGELPEAVGVMLFYMIGEFAQELSVNRSRRSIKALLSVRPDHANVLVDGKPQVMNPKDVQVGEIIIVRPGEKIPLDGDVVRGTSFIDTSPLTGESRPKSIRAGDQVFSGMINQSGLLTVKVSRPFSKSSISRILELVENASSRKAKTEKFITKFARIYSPIVVSLAAFVAIIPPIITGAPFSEWLYRALVVLVISCPCALVISIPLGYFGGVGGASKRGILVKGSNFLDTLASVRTVVFDKTGTLTQGVFRVTTIEPRNGVGKADLLHYAVQAEAGSDHPIAQSIRDTYGDIKTLSIDDYQEFAGHGVSAMIDGQVLLAGSDSLLHDFSVEHDNEICDVDGTVVHLAKENNYIGYLVISDDLKVDSKQAIQELRNAKVKNIIMLTGDSNSTAQGVAQELNLDDFHAGLLPEDKVTILESIIAENYKDGRTAFVGDGINDAPALARADVGIAMGAFGSEAAIETADVVIMTDSPKKIAEAINIGRRTRSIVWQNIIIALIIKAIFIALGVVGIANMWMAVIGDMGVALLAVANSMRVMYNPKNC